MSKAVVVGPGCKLMAVCDDCGKLVRVDKPILGSLHICLSDEERQLKNRSKQQQPWPVQKEKP